MSAGIEREKKMSMRVQHKYDYYPSRDALGLYAGRSWAPGLLERPSRLVIARVFSFVIARHDGAEAISLSNNPLPGPKSPLHLMERVRERIKVRVSPVRHTLNMFMR